MYTAILYAWLVGGLLCNLQRNFIIMMAWYTLSGEIDRIVRVLY